MQGFRNGPLMVSKWCMRPRDAFRAAGRHQSKIYTESNQPDYRQIFAGLTSMQILALYRRLLVRDRLQDRSLRTQNERPGSRDVFSASDGVLARAGASAVAQREATWLERPAAGGGVGSRVRGDRGGIGHERVLQASAGGLCGRRPGRERDRTASPGGRAQ